ncbi:GWxTD domain-containing protein [candidate division KSB1 bacterium]|nr:GWxTD domain-containing protein [candidate division KSB1 bacterium]
MKKIFFHAPFYRRFCACLAVWLIFATNLPANGQPVSPAFQQNFLWDSITTEKQYFVALAAADSLTFQYEFEAPFLCLLDKPQKEYYLRLSSFEDRKNFMRSYWKAANPNPLLPDNDWLLDFIRRFSYVKKNFASPEPPYFDDRGKYYLKYGKPQFRFEDAGSIEVFPNESWSYENVSHNFLVHFVRLGRRYHEVESLAKAIISMRRSKKANVWAVLVTQRAAASPVFARVWGFLEEQKTAQIHARFTSRPGLLAAELQNPPERIFQFMREQEHETSRAKERAPVVAYDPIKAVNRLKFFHNVAQFREPNGYTRVEVVLLTPLRGNYRKKLDPLSSDTLDIEFGCMLRSLEFDSLFAARQQRKIPEKLAAATSLPHAVDQMALVCAPPQAELTLQVRDYQRESLGFQRQTLDIRDFSGHDLMISGIQFYTETNNADQRQFLPLIQKQGMALTPYPYLEVWKNLSLICYFEIYNLKTAGAINEYEITYKVLLGKSGGNVIKKFSNWISGSKDVSVGLTHTRPVIDDMAKELIGIDLSHVPTGVHRLEISVTAANNRRLAASVQRELNVVE